jgi:hypothetical protein
MSNFRRDDESPSEYAERLELAEVHAGRYFADATKDQKAAFDQAMSDLRGLDAPRYDRARHWANVAWVIRTTAARELYEETVLELLATGEVSEAMSYRWDELAVSGAMLEAAE